MNTRSITASVTAMILMSVPAFAQRPAQRGQATTPAQHAPMQAMAGMHQCMDMMGGPSAAMILQHHRQDLALSAQQVERLQALQAKDSTEVMPHMREAMASHEAAAQLLRADHPDFAAYEAKLRDAANHAIFGHVAMARFVVEARDILTPSQQSQLKTAMTGGMMNGKPMPGMGGMKQGAASGMMTMMMMCPMMGGMPSGGAAGKPPR